MKKILWSVIILQSFCLFGKFDIKKMLEKMTETSKGYVYSFEVWNDAHVPVYVEQEALGTFMGAFFPIAKGFYGKKNIPALADAQGEPNRAVYLKENYYFNLYMSSNSSPHTHPVYEESFMQLPLKKNDPNVYYYHAYTSKSYTRGKIQHGVDIEMLGYQNPNELNNSDASKRGNIKFGPQLSQLAFYNSSSTDVQVSLMYDTEPYIFTLEKYSYNFLNLPTPLEESDNKAALEQLKKPPFSLRPNVLKFFTGKVDQNNQPFKILQISSVGFDDTNYVIEIFQDENKPLDVGVQGFNPGNYDLATIPHVRDLTPCPCSFWYQSVAQAGASKGLVDLPGQIWVIYNGADSPIASQVTPGQVVTWNLVRPLNSQADQMVYFFYVATTDIQVAQKFIQNIMDQKIGADVTQAFLHAAQDPMQSFATQQIDMQAKDTSAVTSELSAAQQVQALTGALSVSKGVIEDKEQGVIGYMVGGDIFSPQGVGFGRFYYTLAPSMVEMSGVATVLSGCLDSSKTVTLASSGADLQVVLKKKVQDWFVAYLKNPKDVVDQVQQFLLQYGDSKIVDAAGELTKFGSNRLQAIVAGSVSLKYPPMKLSTISNQYVYDFGKAAPEKMPKESINISLKKLNTANQKRAVQDLPKPRGSKAIFDKDQTSVLF